MNFVAMLLFVADVHNYGVVVVEIVAELVAVHIVNGVVDAAVDE